ncbi:MAG: glycosyltransferase family 9 protein [Candidatus Omnitrophica bacterium]|nr:glycosyltransferase family 9 protein [Candidatus Omnitrophota bacterium]
MRSLRRILLIRNDRMGDLLLTLPAVSALRKIHPKAEITLLVREGLKPLLENHPDVDRLITDGSAARWGGWNMFRWALRLKRERYDAAVIFNPSKLFHAASFLAGIPVRAGYGRKWGRLLTHTLADTKAVRGLHEARYNLELAALLGELPPDPPRLALPERPAAARAARELLAACGVSSSDRPIALHPWTTNAAKCLPASLFWGAARALQDAGQPLLVIGLSDQPLAAPIPQGVIDLTGKTPLHLLPEVLRNCSVLVSNDSGPVHVAASVGTPAVVAAPGSHGRQLQRWRPLGENHKLLMDPSPEQVAQEVRRCLERARQAR